MEKVCAQCKRSLPLEENFYMDARGYYACRCHECRKAQLRGYKGKHRTRTRNIRPGSVAEEDIDASLFNKLMRVTK